LLKRSVAGVYLEVRLRIAILVALEVVMQQWCFVVADEQLVHG